MSLRFRTAIIAVNFVLLILLSGNKKTHSQELRDNSFITIVNPVRISSYTKNSSKSIEAEYFQVKSRELPATWLFSFDVLADKKAVEVIKKFDDNQELGLLLEITPAFAASSGVVYNQTDSWHRANSLFLNGYSQEGRVKLIDHLFEAFKKEFGYYPTSVGAWWIDSYSLEYMSKKYGVVANLNVADQAGTDGYHVWGTYWSIPYYPSKINAAFPAGNIENKLDVVTLRWASRDPLNGYISPDERDSTRFSTQDYFTIGLDPTYFEYLIRLYAGREFGQITVGLEGDFPATVYSKDYGNLLSIVERVVLSDGIKFSTMKDFADMYRNRYKNLSPGVLLETDDLLGSGKRIFWFQNPNYRIGLVYDSSLKQIEIIDIRVYYQNFPEPFYSSSNKQYDLFSIVPAIIDSNIDLKQKIKLDTGFLIDSNNNSITFEKGKIVFEEKRVSLDGLADDIDVPQRFPYNSEGLVFKEINPKIPYAIKSRIPQILIYFFIVVFILAWLITLFFLKKEKPKYAKVFLLGTIIVCLIYIGIRANKPLYVSQSEIDALLILKNLDEGRVLLYDKDCLRCSFTGKNKPAAMEGRKDYVGRLSKKEIVYSLSFVLAKNPDEAKEIIKRTNSKYIYLTKYEDYIEALSFDPKHLGVKRIYENANAAIYEAF